MQSSVEDVNERSLRSSSMCDQRIREQFSAGTSPQPPSVQRKSSLIPSFNYSSPGISVMKLRFFFLLSDQKYKTICFFRLFRCKIKDGASQYHKYISSKYISIICRVKKHRFRTNNSYFQCCVDVWKLSFVPQRSLEDGTGTSSLLLCSVLFSRSDLLPNIFTGEFVQPLSACW